MTRLSIRRWLLVALAVVGLVFAAPVVSAHGNETTADEASPYDGNAVDWTAWMEAQMTAHMGPGAVEWMETHMGVTVDEMAHGRVNSDHGHGYQNDGYGGHGHDDGRHGYHDGRHGDWAHGQGQGC